MDPDKAGAGLSSELQTEAMAAAWRERTEAGTNLYTECTQCTQCTLSTLVQWPGGQRAERSSVTSLGVSGDTETTPGIIERLCKTR